MEISGTHASATIGRMDTPGYRLAIADRAFSFDGVYRLPTSLSVADRAAYGLRDSTTRDGVGGFAIALRAAAVGPTSTVRLGKRCLPYYKDCRPPTNSARRPVETPENIGPSHLNRLGKRCLPFNEAKARPVSSIASFTTVRAAIGDVALQIVALRGRVFIGVHNKCLIPK
jgi:hypothetical protein